MIEAYYNITWHHIQQTECEAKYQKIILIFNEITFQDFVLAAKRFTKI